MVVRKTLLLYNVQYLHVAINLRLGLEGRVGDRMIQTTEREKKTFGIVQSDDLTKDPKRRDGPIVRNNIWEGQTD